MKNPASIGFGYGRLTEECQGDELNTHVAQSNVKTGSYTTGRDTCQVEEARHYRLFLIVSMNVRTVLPLGS